MSSVKRPDKPQPAVKRIQPSALHPLAGLGGHSIPQSGAVGAARGVGAAGAHAAKRKRDEPERLSKPKSKEEANALARREAARARVEQRTLKNFGLG